MKSGFLFLVLATACSPLITSTPPLPPQPVQVAYTTSLQPIRERLHDCALAQPQIALITDETSLIALEDHTAEIILWPGEPLLETSRKAYALGSDSIIMISGVDVTVQDASLEELSELFTDPQSPYQIWTYNQGNELRKIFDQAVLGGKVISPYALQAPHPGAMIEAIQANPLAVGYIPESWLLGNIQTITIDRELQTELKYPILALTRGQASEHLAVFIDCLQKPMR